MQRLWTKFDRLRDGVIHFEEFSETYRGIHHLVQSLRQDQGRQGDDDGSKTAANNNPIQKIVWQIRRIFQQAWQLERRIYVVFGIWIALGISWGMLDQHWDFITAKCVAVMKSQC